MIPGNVVHSNSVGSRLQQDHLPFSPHRVQSRRRRRLWRWCTDKLDRKKKLVDIHVSSLKSIVCAPVISV